MSDKNIVLIHGWGANTAKLEPLMKDLQLLGWKVFLPKLLGFEKPAPRTVWGIKEYSDYIYDESTKRFGQEHFFIFGHSFGGGIAIKLASRNHKNLKGVVLCASRGLSRGKLVKRLVFAALAKAGKVLLLLPTAAGNFRKLIYKAAREHDYEKTQGIMKDIFKKVVSEDLKPYLPEIKKPVLVLWGEMDKATPIKDAYFIKSSLPGSKLITFKNQGHRLPYEKPKEISSKIDKWYKQL